MPDSIPPTLAEAREAALQLAGTSANIVTRFLESLNAPAPADQHRSASSAPVPPDELIRYGVLWRGPIEPTCEPMEDGYWTPWHIAQARIAQAIPEREELAKLLLELADAVEFQGFSRFFRLADRARATARQLGRGDSDG
jgi:hypothetical protein